MFNLQPSKEANLDSLFVRVAQYGDSEGRGISMTTRWKTTIDEASLAVKSAL